MDFLDSTKAFLGPETKDKAFDQHHLFLLDGPGLSKLESFFSNVQQGTKLRRLIFSHQIITSHITGASYPIVADCLKIVTKLCSDLQASTFSILFHPIQEQLNGISESDVWKSASAGSDSLEADMPEFGFR